MNSLQYLSEQVDRVISRSSKASQRLGDGAEGMTRTHSLVDISSSKFEGDPRSRPSLQRSQTLDAYTGVAAQQSGYDGLFRRPLEDIESLASTIRRIGSFVVGGGESRSVDVEIGESSARPVETSRLTETPAPAEAAAAAAAGTFSDGEVSHSDSEKPPLSPRPKLREPQSRQRPVEQPSQLKLTLYYIVTLSFVWDTLKFLVYPGDFLVRVFRNNKDDHSTYSEVTSSLDTPEPEIKDTLVVKRRRKNKFRYPKVLLHPVRAASKTLILDLDETLIHSQSRAKPGMMGHMVEVRLDKRHATLYYVHKRPFCDDFLKLVCKWYNVVVFTASVQEYADPVIDWLEQEQRYFSKRYYRQHCTKVGNGYVKDLTCVDDDLSKLLIIDNSPISYMKHENNAIAIEGWINDPTDADLLCLLPVLNALRYCIDVRQAITLRLGDGAFEVY